MGCQTHPHLLYYNHKRKTTTLTGDKTMREFNETVEKEKMLNRFRQWQQINIEEFIDSLNVRPFIKRDLKRRYKKYGIDLFTGMTPDEFKGVTEMSEQVELALK